MKIQSVIACVVGAIFFIVAGVVAAEETIPEVIHFAGAADGGASAELHPSIYTGLVKFQHEMHFSDYGASCGDCHHDEEREPIDDYSADNSYSCGDCHDGEGLIRGPIAENAASEADLLARRANVLHIRCIGCHKQANAEQHLVRAPEACRICHTKRAQSWVVE
jgi:Class III cytochrome C family